MWTIAVNKKPELPDSAGAGYLRAAHELGLPGVQAVRVWRLYQLHGSLERPQVEELARKLFADPVAETYRVWAGEQGGDLPGWNVFIHYHSGVTDPAAASIRKALDDRQLPAELQAHTAVQCVLQGELTAAQVDELARRLLANTLIQDYVIRQCV